MRRGLSEEEVARRLAGANRTSDIGQRVLAFYLVEVDDRRLYQATGHGSTAHYAEARLDIDRRRTGELVAVGRKLADLAAIDAAFCDGRLGWAKLLTLARVTVPEHEAAWLARALELDARKLALLAKQSKEGGPPRSPGDERGLSNLTFPYEFRVGSLAHATLTKAQQRLRVELGREVDLAEMVLTLAHDYLSSEADGTVPGRRRVDVSPYRVTLVERVPGGASLLVESEDGPLPIDAGGPGRDGAMSEAVRCDSGRRTYHGDDHRARDVKTPSRLRRSVLCRDGHRCRSCTSKRTLMVHHVEFRSHGGRTRPENLITLCERCHALVHEGFLRIEGPDSDRAQFVDAQARPIVGVAKGTAIAGPEVAPIAQGAESPGSRPVCPPPPLVSLATIPDEVDAEWWRRHCHLVHDRRDGQGLVFESGVSKDAPRARVAPPPPAEAAFQGVVGEERRIELFTRAAKGARELGKPFPHVLLTGPAGTGKTSFARGIAAIAERPMVVVSGAVLTERLAWVRLLAGLPDGCVLFLDEAHALPRSLLEVLLEAMSERRLSLVLSEEGQSRTVTLRLPSFTLVAATTNSGAIPSALMSRFGIREFLDFCGNAELAQIVMSAAKAQGVVASEGAARRLGEAARGRPREALRLLERTVTDLRADDRPVGERGAVFDKAAVLDEAAVEATMRRMGYRGGLDLCEQRYLRALHESPSAAVPLSRLSRMLGTTPESLIEHIEPHLFALGFVRTTPQGRVATPLASPAHATRRHVGGETIDEARIAPFVGAFVGATVPNVRRDRSLAAASP